MDGLRKLPRASKSELNYYPQTERLTAVSITPEPGASPQVQCGVQEIPLQQCPSFLRKGLAVGSGSTGNTQHSLRLVYVPSSGPDCILIGEQDFAGILKEVDLDPWMERLRQTWTYGYHHSGHVTKNNVAHHYLGADRYSVVWTTACNGSQFATAGMVVFNPDYVHYHDGQNISRRITEILRLFQNDSQSPLYLPFALSVDIFRSREERLKNIYTDIQHVESITGHGSWGQGIIRVNNPTGTTELTARLGAGLNNVANTYKYLSIVDLIWKDLEAISLELAGTDMSEGIRASNSSILDAIAILRQQSLQAREQAQYLEVRIRSQSSVLFSLLTHNDAKVNIRVANASVELAAAARRDGSSMKTIAVLTMAFLPATFFAAFFSMPSLGWDGPDKFPLFWACTVPITLATFILWAGITQREAMRDLVRDFVVRRQEARDDRNRTYTLSPRKSERALRRAKEEKKLEEMRRDQEIRNEDCV